MVHEGAYLRNSEGIHVARPPITHREDEYDPQSFETLLQMQQRHFWYRGRHRFLLCALRHQLSKWDDRTDPLRAIDLGGGCGGWVRYLCTRAPDLCDELALGDSSVKALEYAEAVVDENVDRYQIDLLQLGWQQRWDVAFLLDVLEHIPEHVEAMHQIRESLSPGGLLFVTTPALQSLWSYNDELVHHVRRYARDDYRQLAEQSGLELVWSRYFMFFLSVPLLLSRRMRKPDLNAMSLDERQALLRRTHRVPSAAVNRLLGAIFAMETPVGHWVAFPWGTSILGVFRRP